MLTSIYFCTTLPTLGWSYSKFGVKGEEYKPNASVGE